MAIRLIREDEHLTCEMSGVTFHYRRPTPNVSQSLREKHTSRGIVNDEAFCDEMLRHCVFNWEGDIGVDDSGEPVPFDPALLAFLPTTVKVYILGVLSEQVDAKHAKANPI